MPGRPKPRSPRRRPRSPAGGHALTSTPTSRGAYEETRQWLLHRHGPICAYCGIRVKPGVITLDHVTPRRGQSAYDRRDNLVLACQACNKAKKDSSILAFLLGRRSRATSLLKYGEHLSPLLVEMATQLAETPPPGATKAAPAPKTTHAPSGKRKRRRRRGPSPYLDEDSPYREG